MTLQKWCEENEINLKIYYYHLRKLREQCAASAPTIVPLAVTKQTADISAVTLIALVHELY